MNEKIKAQIAKNKSLLESFVSLSLLNGLNILLPLVTLPYILRIIGSANYGIYSYIYVIVQYLILLTSYGFNLSATQQIVNAKNDKSQVDIIFNSVITCRLILLLSGILFIILLSPLLLHDKIKQIMFFMGLGIVLGDILNAVWLFQGMEKMRYMTIVNVISKLIFTILIFVFIRYAEDYKYLILLNSLGFLIAGIISILIAKKQFKINFFIPKWDDIRYQFKQGLSLFGVSLGTNLYSNSNIFILNFFVGESALGIYAAAEKIIKGLQTLTSPITQALFPHIGDDFRNKSISYKLYKISKLSKTIFLIFLLPNFAIFFSAGILVKIFCGPGYNESILLLKIMSPVVIIGTMNYVIGIIGLVNLNMQRIFFYGVMISGLLSILFVLCFAPHCGVLAASIAVPLSEFILLIICATNIKRIKKRNYE